MTKEELNKEALKMLEWPAEEFASGLITMLFLNVLHPRGVKGLTVVANNSVFTLGEGNPGVRLQHAKCLLDAEISKGDQC